MSPPLTPPPESRHIRRPKVEGPFWGPKTYKNIWKINKFGLLGLLGLQEGFKTAQDGPKAAQDGPKTAQDGPKREKKKTAQEGPENAHKSASRSK